MKKLLSSQLILLAFAFISLNAAVAQEWAPMNSGITAGIWNMWGTAGNNMYAVSPDSGGYAVIHYNGGTWSSVRSGSFTSVWGSSSTDVFAVRGDGKIEHYNGSAWSIMNSGTSTPLYCVWGSSASDVFVLGAAGMILHYDGNNSGVWSAMSSGTGIYLGTLWGSSSSDVFAGGSYGTILHYDGSTWSAMNSGTTRGINGIWGTSSSDVYAVCSDGTILHYDGSAWSVMSSGTTNGLNDIWGSSSTDIYAVGGNGTILHYDGSAWSAMNSGTTKGISAVWGGSATDVFAGGSEGMILHYMPPVSSTTTTICDITYWQTLYENCQTELEECRNQTTTTTPPTLIELSSLKTLPENGKVILKWETESEINNAGFNVWRAEGFKKINELMIPALGSSTAGSEYEYIDLDVLNLKPYFYLLEDIDNNGISTFHGPVNALPRMVYGVKK